MRLIEYLTDLALRQLRGGGATLLRLPRDRTPDHRQRILAALHLANRRAWLALELALAGPALASTAGGARTFLAAFPLAELKNRTHFRQECHRELREAHRRDLLTGDRLTETELEHEASELVQELRPLATLQVEWRAQDGIAGELEQHGFTSLPWLLRQRPDGRPPLLLTAMRFCFRRIVEEDAELGPAVPFARAITLPTAQASGLATLHEELRTHTREIEGFLDDVAPPALETGTVPVQPREVLPHLQPKTDPVPEVLTVTEGVDESAETPSGAYLAALRSGRYDAALEHLHEALRRDPGRLTPFPIDEYEPLRILGAGAFEVTVLCRARSMNCTVAVKSLTIGESARRVVATAFREAIILHQLHHPGIIRLHRWGYADPEKTRPYLVMEYFPGQTLQEYIAEHGPLPFAEFKELARQVAEALRSAHARGILHRGINPARLLLRRPEREDMGMWEIRIIDFGLAIELASPESPPVAGWLDYAAPEQRGQLPGVEPGVPADVYAFARTCCYALFRTAAPSAEDWRQESPSLADLLRACLAPDPGMRVRDFDAVLERLAHVRTGSRSAKKSAAVISPPRLVVQRGLRLHVEYVLHEGANVIGRDARGATLDVDLEDQEPDGSVLSSRRHALVTWKQGKLTITDLHSANGTRVNRAQLAPGEEHPLNDQDVLQVGSVLLRVILES
jgi:serine/threonine protein kinase